MILDPSRFYKYPNQSDGATFVAPTRNHWLAACAEFRKAQDGGANEGEFHHSFEKYYIECTTGTLHYVSGGSPIELLK